MADGDLILTLRLVDQGVYESVPDPVPPPMGSCGAELYEACGPLAHADHEHGWALAHLCEALGRMRQAVSDLVRDSDEGPGWSAATDVDRAPGKGAEIDMLPFLAMLAGVRLTSGLDDAERRLAILEREGFHRGRPAAITSFAARYVDDPGAVMLRERYNPSLGAGVDAPYHGRVIVRRSALLPGVDEAELRARILARVPAGLVYDVLVTDDRDYDEIAATYTDYADVLARTTDYDDLLEA